MNELRAFASTDWDAFAGAEDFADGSAPMIGECDVDDGDGPTSFSVIACGSGTMCVVEAFSEYDEWYSKDFANKAAAVAVANMLINAPAALRTLLTDLDFRRLG